MNIERFNKIVWEAVKNGKSEEGDTFTAIHRFGVGRYKNEGWSASLLLCEDGRRLPFTLSNDHWPHICVGLLMTRQTNYNEDGTVHSTQGRQFFPIGEEFRVENSCWEAKAPVPKGLIPPSGDDDDLILEVVEDDEVFSFTIVNARTEERGNTLRERISLKF